MNESDVIKWLLSESETVLQQSNLVSLTTPANHVDVAEPSMSHPYPFIGIQKITTNTRSAGMGGGDLFVDELTYTNGTLDSITYRRDSSLRVNVIPVTDDAPSLRDDLADEVTDHFSLFARTGGEPDDMDPPDIDDSTPTGRSDDVVDASGIAMTIDYETFIVDNDPQVADTVNVDIEVGDRITDLEEWSDDTWGDNDWGSSDPVAYHETF